MSELGINVAARAEQSPGDIAALGATWARCVALPGVDLSNWIRGCHDRGVRVLLVLASESIGQAPGGWVGAIDHFAERYLGLADAWQVGNEPDHESPSSWTMKAADLNQLLKSARDVLGVGSFLVGPGLVSGQPSWVQHINLDLVDALAFHPYAKLPGTLELDRMIAGYQAASNGKPLWITEYNARTIGMAAALKNDPRLTNVLAFCYSDSMVQGFGLVENPAALADYLAASGGPIAKPPGKAAEYVLGFKRWHDLEPQLLGRAVRNEATVAPQWQTQRTSNGTLAWVAGKGHAFVTDDGRIYHWEEDWAQSREVLA